jgi:hypothetical protein
LIENGTVDKTTRCTDIVPELLGFEDNVEDSAGMVLNRRAVSR